MKLLKLCLIFIFSISIFLLPSCADYENYSYTTSTEPAEPIESTPKRLKLFSDGSFGIYSDLLPISVLWDVDTKMDIWPDFGANADVTDVTTDTFEGFYTWRFEGTGTWMGIGVRVEPLTSYKDLSIYSNGHFNFAYKGTNRFKIAMKSTSPTVETWYNHTGLSNYGLRLDNTWCEISIPFTDIFADYSTFNIASIEQYFMFVQDAPLGYSAGVVHFVDNLHLTKD